MAALNQTGAASERHRIAKEMTDMLTADGHVVLPLIHRGMIGGHANSLAGILPNGWEGSLWNIADWSRAE